MLEGLVHIEYSPLCRMTLMRGRLQTGGLSLLGGQMATGQHLMGGHEFGGQPGLGGLQGLDGHGLGGQGVPQVTAQVGLGLQGAGPQGVQGPQLPHVPHEPQGPHGVEEQQPDFVHACFCMRRSTEQAMWPGLQPHLNWKAIDNKINNRK